MTFEPECELCDSNESNDTANATDEPLYNIQNEQPQQEINVPHENYDPDTSVVGSKPNQELVHTNKSLPHEKTDTQSKQPQQETEVPHSKIDSSVDQSERYASSSGTSNSHENDYHHNPDGHEPSRHQFDHAISNETQEGWHESHINQIDSKSTSQNKTVSFTSVLSLITKTINVTGSILSGNSTRSNLHMVTEIPVPEAPNLTSSDISDTGWNTSQTQISEVRSKTLATTPTVPISSEKLNTTNGVYTSTLIAPQARTPISVNTSTISPNSNILQSTSTVRQSSTSAKDIKHRDDSTMVALPSPTRSKPTSASASIPVHTTTEQTMYPVDMRQHPIPPGHPTPASSTNKAVYAVPVILGLLIIGLLLIIILYTRRRTRNNNSKLWLKSSYEAKDELLEKGLDVYAQVDLSQKANRRNGALAEVIPLSVVISDNDSEQEPIMSIENTPSTCPTSSAIVHTNNTSHIDHLADHVIYERPASLTEDTDDTDEGGDTGSEAASPPPSATSASQVSASAPPMMHPLSTMVSGAASSHNMSQPAEYLIPSCHQHQPQGPNWRPFHDYDPVYVPTSNASAMNRRVDSTGYVRTRPQSPTIPQVYEEINYGAMTAPPLKPRMTMGATASGGRSARAPPPLPPSLEFDGNYTTSPMQCSADTSSVTTISTASSPISSGIYARPTLSHGARPSPTRHYESGNGSNMDTYDPICAQNNLSDTAGTEMSGSSTLTNTSQINDEQNLKPHMNSTQTSDAQGYSEQNSLSEIAALPSNVMRGGRISMFRTTQDGRQTDVSQANTAQLSTRISVASSTGSKDEPQYEVVDFHDNEDDT